MKATIVFEKIWNAIHEIDENGNRKYKYIILTGSSRSSKTYSILQLIHLYCLKHKKKRVSSWRETKKDCKDTVLFDFKNALPNFPQWEQVAFNKTESIHTYPNGSTYEISGGDDDVKIHGFQGDVAHFNEPYNISKDTFDQIDMRTTDFVLIDWNPRQNHWIDELSKNPRAIVIHSTFRDNPFVPFEQRSKILSYQNIERSYVVSSKMLTKQQALEYDLISNVLELPQLQLSELQRCILNEKHHTANPYKWSVYGLGEKAEKPNRIFHWNKCTLAEYNQIEATPIIGIDWGKVDPFGIVEAKYSDGRLFLKELNYDSEDTIRGKLSESEMRNIMAGGDGEHGIVSYVFSKLNIDKSTLLICDTNRPEKGALLRRKGYNIIPASKGKGSILDGVEILQSLEVYYTECSTNIEIEQENYEYKVDKFGDQEEELIDAFNHCFTGDTLITTITGQKEIKDITTNDLVLTSNGYRQVIHKFNNGKKRVLKYLLQFDTFSVYLCCTENHLIKTASNWKKISQLEKNDVLYWCNNCPQTKSIFQEEHKLVGVKIIDSWNENVFDLMVNETHEYFANGVLVHNCIDPTRYIAIHLRNQGKIKVL